MKKLTLCTLAVLALVFAIASVGAYDHGNITILRLLVQVGIATLVEWLTLSHLED